MKKLMLILTMLSSSLVATLQKGEPLECAKLYYASEWDEQLFADTLCSIVEREAREKHPNSAFLRTMEYLNILEKMEEGKRKDIQERAENAVELQRVLRERGQ